MKRAFLMMVLAIAAGCGSGDDSMSGSGTMTPTPSSGDTITCTASLKMSNFDYALKGDMLTVTSGTMTAALQRAGTSTDGTRAVYGTWSLPVQTDPAAQAKGLSVTATLDIESDHVTARSACSLRGKSLTALATAKATVTDSNVAILEDKVDIETAFVP